MFLKKIEEEMKDLLEKSFFEPEEDLLPDDRVVGTIICPEMKRTYTLGIICREMAITSLQRACQAKGQREERDSVQKSLQLFKKAEHIMNDFLLFILDHFSLWEKEDVSVKKGWIVVLQEDEVIFVEERSFVSGEN